MSFLKICVIIFLIQISLQQDCGGHPGCLECHWIPNPCGMACTKYVCDTVACGNCSNNTCTGCVDGYALQNKECNQCAYGCQKCSYNKNEQECSECSSGYYYIEGNKTCQSCYNFMSECSTCEYSNEKKLKCTSCYYGNALNMNNVCEQCPGNCSYCGLIDKKFQCTTCNDGYALNINNICEVCSSNCQQCGLVKEIFQCTICNYGYALNGDNTCDVCPQGSTSCQWNGKKLIATACDTYNQYYLNSKTQECSLCPKNCQSCIENNSSDIICTSCNFQLNNGFINLQGRCQSLESVTNNCASANYSDGKLLCQSCNAGFELDQNTNKCTIIKCGEITENCTQCQYSQVWNGSQYVNQKSCATCANGYTFDNNYIKCLKCEIKYCSQCQYNTSQCTQCQNGFYLTEDSISCLPLKDEIPNCLYGQVQSGSTKPQCEACIGQDGSTKAFFENGYYTNVNQTQCLACTSGCSYCEEEGYCQTCKAGYYSIIVNNLGNYVCEKINIENCAAAAAYGNSYQCTECMPGYYGINGICKKISAALVEQFLQYIKI